jgi:glycosyltransferase involved in cell wall biosynthesis
MPQGLDDKALLKHIHESKICVYAPHLEPFGLVPLEAMAAGLPVVGIREGGVRESVTHGVTGLICQREEQEFASAIRRLLVDSALRDTMSHNASDHVQRLWTWERTVDSVEECLASFKRSKSKEVATAQCPAPE